MNITAGKLKGQKVLAPDEKLVRPTLSKIRMAVFNILQSEIDFEDKSFLDMFAGSGIMGLEALSRGFLEVTELEKNRHVFNVLKKNYENLGLKANLLNIDSLKFKTDKHFDVIYIDPPYYEGFYENCIKNLPSFSICILEYPESIDLAEINAYKQKKYGDKILAFIKPS